MSIAPPAIPETAPLAKPSLSQGRSRVVLLAIIVAYLIFRLPFVLEQLPGQDESWFAVPGLMIARGGVPRIPYYPARDPKAFFYRADEILLEMPPGLFFLQAPFALIAPPGVAAGRLPSLIAGAIAIVLVFQLGRRAYGAAAGLWGAAFYAMSRVLFFAATFARPDECCTAFGLGAIVVLWDALAANSRRRIAFAGALLGFGFLCHPFAITYSLLCGVWVLLSAGEIRQRVANAAILTLATLAVFALWIPLILQSPEIFRHQFFNTMNLTGPGLFQRLVWPWPYIPHQCRLLFETAGVWQLTAMSIGLIGATMLAIRRPVSSARRMVGLTWGSIYLLTACQGLHPTKGYWSFTGAIVLVNLGFVAHVLASGFGTADRRLRTAGLMMASAFALMFLPESGVRMWWLHVRPDSEARYDGPAFTRQMIAELPATGRYVVEPQFIFDVWLSSRVAVVRVELQDYLIDKYDYDWLLVSRDGLEKSVPERLKGRFVRSFGVKDDPLACYAELYEPAGAVP
jgi:4-amino-4-deoxy-L-arabinose transferase-like glycosyltransferase